MDNNSSLKGKMYEQILHAIDRPVLVVDDTAKIKFGNEAAADLFECKRSNLTETPLEELFVQENFEELLARIEQATGPQEREEKGTIPTTVVPEDEQKIPVTVHVFSLEKEENQVVLTITPLYGFQQDSMDSSVGQRDVLHLLDQLPVGLLELDLTETKSMFDALTDDGHEDLDAYFQEHPEEMEKAVEKIRVHFANQLALKRFQANDLKAFDSLTTYFRNDSYEVARDLLIPFYAEGKLKHSRDAAMNTAYGSEIHLHLTLTFVPGHNEDWSRMLLSIIDISDRVEAERELARKANQLRITNDRMPGVSYRFKKESDGEYTLSYISKGIEEITGVPPEKAMKNFENITERYHPQEREELLASIDQAVTDVTVWEKKHRFLKPDGTVKWVYSSAVPLSEETPDGTRVWAGVLVDITEQVEARQSLEQALEEKKMLLQEVHHRVKNNMEMISSMLRLQLGTTDNEELEKVLSECLNRIQSMALVHQMLYEEDDLDQLSLPSYGQNIIDQIWSSYLPSDTDVRKNVEIEDLTLELDQAIPCGLILNELVSNALQHAFPDREKGTIEVKIQKESGTVVLSVQDDGVGMPDDVDPEDPKHLGLRLVRSMVQNNLQGTLNFSSNGGTEVTVRF